MAKKQFGNPRDYAVKLSQIIQDTENAGEGVAPYFEKLRDAIDADQVAALPKTEFEEISAEFDDVVEVYKNAVADIKNLKAPVRLIGVHGNLVNTFTAYYEATDAMAKSLNVAEQSIDMTAFEKSEHDQDTLMEEFLKQVRRVMTSVM
ncbi:MAG: hypothetical protein LBT80_07335 [Lactobacillaceae bacterium]|nr:hypothetical protein [Lactobacillaceae bacterium]